MAGGRMVADVQALRSRPELLLQIVNGRRDQRRHVARGGGLVPLARPQVRLFAERAQHALQRRFGRFLFGRRRSGVGQLTAERRIVEAPSDGGRTVGQRIHIAAAGVVEDAVALRIGVDGAGMRLRIVAIHRAVVLLMVRLLLLRRMLLAIHLLRFRCVAVTLVVDLVLVYVAQVVRFERTATEGLVGVGWRRWQWHWMDEGVGLVGRMYSCVYVFIGTHIQTGQRRAAAAFRAAVLADATHVEHKLVRTASQVIAAAGAGRGRQSRSGGR